MLVVKPTLMSFFWLFGLCLFDLLFAMYDKIGLHTSSLRYEYP